MAKKPRDDQPGIDGIADEKNNRVHSAAKHYAKMRDARMAAGDVEKAAKDKLLDIMKEEGIETYSYGDVDVCTTVTEGVKVTIGKKVVKGEDDTPEDE